MTDIIFALAEIVFVVSYFFRDMLLLRLGIMTGLAGYVIGALVAGYNAPGMKAVLIFGTINFLINGYQSIRLIAERFPVFLPETLQEIYKKDFYIMTTHEFLKIYALSSVKKYTQGECIAVQNQPITDLILIKRGVANVLKNDRSIAKLTTGFFIGEMSFLTKGLATATVQVGADGLECITWSKEQLNTLEHTNLGLYAKLKQVIAVNLIKKIDQQEGTPADA